MIAWAKYFPALFFFVLWVQFINGQLAVERAIFTSPIGSPAMERGLGWAMDDPWQQKGAGMLYFRRLEKEGAAARIWLNSDVYAQAVWEQGQFPGSLQAMIRVAVLKKNHFEIDRLTKLYMSAYPRHRFTKTIEGFLHSRQLNSRE